MVPKTGPKNGPIFGTLNLVLIGFLLKPRNGDQLLDQILDPKLVPKISVFSKISAKTSDKICCQAAQIALQI